MPRPGVAIMDSPAFFTLRVVVLGPPAGVTWALQIGRDALEGPVATARGRITFTTQVRVAKLAGKAMPRLLGVAVQGPPDRRFLYLNSGVGAGQVATCWDRRAKVPLWPITWSMIDSVMSKTSKLLEAQIFGRAKDGGPACASVQLLGKGWQVR